MVIACAFAFQLLTVESALAGTMKDLALDPVHQSKAANGIYQAVGKVTSYHSAGFVFTASGTLISDRWVLTAAHNVATSMDDVTFTVGGNTYEAEKWYIHRGYDVMTTIGDGHDIALVKLGSKVNGVRPAPYTRQPKVVGKKVTIVGFGATGTGDTGAMLPLGTKRAGDNLIDGYHDRQTYGKRIITYDFDPDNPSDYGVNPTSRRDDFALPLEYSAAGGDSGGGVFRGKNLVGVTAWNEAPDIFGNGGEFFSTTGSTSVAAHLKWIKTVKRRDRRGKSLGWLAEIHEAENALPAAFAPGLAGNLAGLETQSQIVPLAALVGTPTPEPTSVALLMTGGIGVLLRRNKRAA